MAERQASVRKDIRWLKSTVKSGKLLNVYLLMGGDTELVEEAIEVLKGAVLAGESAELNFASFKGDEAQADDLLCEVLVAPFFAEKRLVLLREVQKMGQSEIARLVPMCKAPPATSCVILTAPKAEGVGPLLEAIDEGGTIVYLEAPKGRALALRMMEKAKEAGLKIGHETISRFLELSGDNIATISSEWEKIASYALSKGEISADEVEKLMGDRREIKVFVLTDALAAGDFKAAAEALSKLLAGGEEWTHIMAVIAWQFRTIWRIKNCSAEGLAVDAIAARLGLPQNQVKRIAQNAKRFTEGRLIEIFNKILETDLKLKTTGADEVETLELMLWELCRVIPALGPGSASEG